MNHGFVSLIGAGCGDADLITLRGLSHLQRCDAVIYDDLIDPALLDIAPDGAQRIYMGKRSRKHSASQEEITQTLIRLAASGMRVARLKGGDPFVFGRGGEEILALQAAEISYEVIPGISSAIAIPSSAGIPVTHRGMSRSVHIITGHTADCDNGLPSDLLKLAQTDGTLVILMGLRQLPRITELLMAHGKSPDTPAAVLSGGNSPNPASVRGSLLNIAQLAKDVQSPAVIVVGEVAALDLSPAPRPLDGVCVGITGTAEVARKQIDSLRTLGARTHWLCRSTVNDLSWTFDDAALTRLPGWLVFTSANGVHSFFRRLSAQKTDLRTLAHCRFAVIGPATQRALASYGFYADLCPSHSTSRALAEELLQSVLPNQPIFLLRSAIGNPILPQMLSESGFCVHDIPIYDVSVRPDDAPLPKLDYLTFSSAGSVDAFFLRYGPPPAGTVCVCIGEVTAQRLAQHIPDKPLLSREITAEGIVRAISEHHCST